MKKVFLSIVLMLIAAVGMQAEIKFGVRGGYNITKMSFNESVMSADNKAGFYIGPTVKIGLPMNFALDASLLYDQRDSDPEIYMTEGDNALYDTKYPDLTRKALAVPVNLRMSFGLGSLANVFILAGPQLDVNLGSDISVEELEWNWKKSTYSVNVGAGLLLANRVEVKFNYNIPCSDSGSFSIKNAASAAKDGIKGKTGAWQIGAAVYF